MTNEELMSLLIPIISLEYNVNIKDWLYYAKPNEKKVYIKYLKLLNIKEKKFLEHN